MDTKRNPFWSGIVLLSLSALTACSSVSLTAEQCLAGNWQAIGYNDGVAGRFPSRISDHQQACAETGVIPNFHAWQRGREQGLVHYCTEANARRLGQSGRRFNAVCPAGQASHLQKVHERAYNHYQRQQAIQRDTRKLARYRDELSKLRGGDMLGFTNEAEAREYMLRLQDRIRELEREIRQNRRANRFD